jgi:hypothetical protein
VRRFEQQVEAMTIDEIAEHLESRALRLVRMLANSDDEFRIEYDCTGKAPSLTR